MSVLVQANPLGQMLQRGMARANGFFPGLGSRFAAGTEPKSEAAEQTPSANETLRAQLQQVRSEQQQVSREMGLIGRASGGLSSIGDLLGTGREIAADRAQGK